MELNNLDFRYFRNMIAGTLTALNKAAKVLQVEKGIPVTYDVPIYYDFASDGQFMRDFFYKMPTWCEVPEHVEGMFERVPYGVISADSINVMQQEITSRFSRGNFDQLVVDVESGEQALLAYSSFLFVVPLQVTFNGTFKVDNMLQSFNIIESLLEYLYKNTVSYFQYNGLRIPLMVTFGDKGSITRKIPLTYKDNQQKEIPFSLEVESYFPIFDKEEEGSLRFRGDKIRQFYTEAKTAETGEKMSAWSTPDYVDFESDITTPISTDIVNFTDLSKIEADDWLWEIIPDTGYTFTNGTTAKSQNPSIIFDQGVYTVILTASVGEKYGKRMRDDYIISS